MQAGVLAGAPFERTRLVEPRIWGAEAAQKGRRTSRIVIRGAKDDLQIEAVFGQYQHT